MKDGQKMVGAFDWFKSTSSASRNSVVCSLQHQDRLNTTLRSERKEDLNL